MKEKELLSRFDRDFRKYLNASIAYAEIQKPYRPLDIEDEISWLKQWLDRNVVLKRRKVIHLGHDRALTWCGRKMDFFGDEGFSRVSRVCRECKKRKESGRF